MSPSKFNAESTAEEVIKGIDLSGQVAIVTGGASGIGVETVKQLALAGADVIIATRDLKKAEEVAEQLQKETGKNHISAEKLDLGSLASVNEFCKRFLAKDRPLNLLINNAGIMACPKGKTTDGTELQFGTNHIGHFALTMGLLPALKAAATKTGKKSRVVSVSSAAHLFSDVLFDDYNFEKTEYQPWVSYGQSKTANTLFALGFNERYASEGVVCNSLHPGSIATGLQKHMSQEQQVGFGIRNADGTAKKAGNMKSVEQGAATTIYVATSPDLEGVGGKYFEDCDVAVILNEEQEAQVKKALGGMMAAMSGAASEAPKSDEKPKSAGGERPRLKGCFSRIYDKQRADKLWAISEKLTNQK